ncbi:MAG: beta-ketoacyl synthase N-terminal-like domain-containing protein, partial [Acutalibacteraceae bacterium]|nr:beta-ketoacyl synthase N-terminal-like domain-containing protein [Acutalibacteraceae bacterium]
MRGIKDDDIAIIGYAFDLPDGIDTNDKFWELMESGNDAIREIPEDRWDWKKIYDSNPDAEGKSYSYHGAFLKDIKKFDSNAFRIMPVECKNIDPQQRIVLKTAWRAMENSFLDIESLKHSDTGVFMGATMDDYLQLQTRIDGGKHINRYTHFGGVLNNIAGRVSFVFGFNGPSMTIDTACSSSLIAVDSAIKAINEGDCNIALAGGVNVILTEEMYMKFSRTQMLSKTGKCKTFDDGADGYVRAEGCGIVVLMKYSQAVLLGKKILAVIRGCSVNHNGNSGALTVPSGRAQAMLINNCMSKAGVDIEDIDYVEAHGTGTQLGDKIEVNALQEVFKERKNPLLIGSVKTNLGHLESAAGVTGLIKVLLCMERNTIVRTAEINEKNHKINWDKSVIKISENNINWESKNKIAGVSSFGASGTNAHIILQKYDNITKEDKHYPDGSFAIAVSAKSYNSLHNLLKSIYSHIKDKDDTELRKICKTYNVCRSHYKIRCCVYGENRTEFLKKFEEKISDFTFENEKVSLNEAYISNEVIYKTDFINNLLNNNINFSKIVQDYSNLFNFNVIPSEFKNEVNEIIMIASFYKFLLEIGYKKIKIIGDKKVNLAKSLVDKNFQISTDEIVDLLKNTNEVDYLSTNESIINNKEIEEFLMFEDISQESIADLLLKKAVEQYEAGINIQWKMFYNDLKVDVDFLPEYVFDEQDYWIDYQRHSIDESSTINPFNKYIETINDISDEKSFIWDITFWEDSDLVNEHILNGKKILVGMFQIQLICELLKQKSVSNYSISDLRFIQKIEIPKNKKIRVKIDILQDNNYKGEINYLNTEDGEWISKTIFNITNSKIIEKNDDVESFFDDVEFIENDQFYETLQKAGLCLGNHFKILDSIIYSPNMISANIDNSVFIPAVLDAASQLIYLFRDENDKGLYLPYNFKGFVQYDSLNLVDRVETELIEKKKNELIAKLTYYKNQEIIAVYNECHLIKVNSVEKPLIEDIVGLPIRLPSGVDLYNNIIKVIGTSLNDHAVYKRLTIPGAYYISQIMELAEQEYVGKMFLLSDINFYNAVVLNENEKIRELIQVEKDDKGYNVIVYSSVAPNKNYLQNAKLHIDDVSPSFESNFILEDVKFDNHYTKDEILKIQRRIGLHLGNTFNWMQEIWVNDTVIKARIQNDDFINLVGNFGTPPGLIDTSVQILGLIKNITQSDEGAYIPLSIGKIIKYSDLQNSMWCVAKLIREKGEVIVGDIIFYDNYQKHKILEINEISLIKADAKKLGKTGESDKLLFNQNWQKINVINLESKYNKQ